MAAADSSRRPPTPEVNITEALQPVAAPVNAEFRHPAASGPSPLHGIAEALSAISGDLAAWGAKQKQKQDEEDTLRGEAAFYEGTAGGYAQGVADGVIPADKSPKFIEGYKRAMGMSAGISLDSYLGESFQQWTDKTNPDPEAFNQWFGNTVKSQLKTQDPDIIRGLAPYLRSAGQKYHSMWQSEVTQNTQNTALASYGAAIASTIDDAISDAQQDGTTLNLDQLGTNIDAIRDHGKGIGLRNDQVDKLVADTIQVKALTSRDPTLLSLFDRKSASGPPLGDTPHGLAVKAEVTSSLMRLWKTEESEARLQQERQDKLAANTAKRTIVEQILKDPNAPIDEQQLAPILKLDDNFKLDLMKWRDDIRTRNIIDDPSKVSLLYQDILSGGGDGVEKVTSAIRSGDVRNPENIRQAITFAKAMQDYGQRPDGILSTSAARSYIGQIQMVGQDSKMSRSRIFGDPATLTEDGRTALNNYRYGLMQWQMKNANASPLEREQFATSFGESILKSFRPVGRNLTQREYTPPPSVQGQPQAAPLAGDTPQIPSTPNRATQHGTEQPPTAQPQPATSGPLNATSINPLYRAMSPDQRSAVEGLAKRKGMTVDDFLGGIQTQPQAPQQPGKRSDAGGGTIPFAAINPRSMVETARSVADRLGLGGIINSQVPVSETPQPSPAALNPQQQVPSGKTIEAIGAEAPQGGEHSPLTLAKSYLGKYERDPEARATLSSFFAKFGGIHLDPATTPWCAAFANAVLGASGIKGTGKANARSFLDWGTPTDNPSEGDIVVFRRGNSSWQGHVAFFVGFDGDGNIKVLGGNQHDHVSITTMPRAALLGFRRAPDFKRPRSREEANLIQSSVAQLEA
ncbi:MAG: hypothetical protein NTAFB05_20900 [Nitrobacter sp.]|uniref:TIGR02594 family protein n=1 Tax=Nitrobacter sp. TaxID=29420 RepID=UPI00387DD863